MPRDFDGTDDVLTLAGGNTIGVAAGFTWAALVKRMTDTGIDAIAGNDTSGGTARMEFGIIADDSLFLYSPTFGAIEAPTIAVTNAMGWCYVGVDKATGSSDLQFHKLRLNDASAFVHEAGSAVVDPTSSGAGGIITIGEADGDFGDLEIAFVALFNRQLTSAEHEAIAYGGLMALLALAPVGLWLLDQAATAQGVIDLTGGGANQTGLVGTTVPNLSLIHI